MSQAIGKQKMLVKAAVGKALVVKPDVLCVKEKFGSSYGGWDVIVTNIDRDSVVYSFGVGEDASFETALIERFGLTVHAFDPTPRSIQWMKNQGFSEHFVMHKYGIAAFDGIASFNPPENPDHVSHTMFDRASTAANAIRVPVRRLGTIMSELGHDRIDVLKMHIEGAEYRVIKESFCSGQRPSRSCHQVGMHPIACRTCADPCD